MTPTPDETDQDIAADVLPEEIDELAVPMELDKLFPWHRARKQFVRERQWIAHSRQLISRLMEGPALRGGTGRKPEVRYLTLPGIDYLDVRMMAECCSELGCDLTTTGYLAGDQINPELARAKVREESLIKAGYITDYSQTFKRRIEEISSDRSQAYRELRRRGPFHVVNIDACGSIAPPSANHAARTRTIDAIYRIVELQLETNTGRWLMFLTTDVRAAALATETLECLCKAIIENAEKDAEFGAKARALLADAADTLKAAIDEAASGDGLVFLRLFSLGLAKWLIHLAATKSWDMKMHNLYCYSTTPKGDNNATMPSLAFEFVPPNRGLTDPFGVTNARPAQSGTAEDTSMRTLDKVGAMIDLDQRMHADKRLQINMIENTRILLKEAGYAASALAALDDLNVQSACD